VHRVSLRERDESGLCRIAIDDRQLRALCLRDGAAITVAIPGEGSWRLAVDDSLSSRMGDAAGDDRVASPIPGRVAAVLCGAGDVVARGQVLVVVEAMKTELRIAAPIAGTVARVAVAVGDQVEEGAELVALDPARAATEAGR